MTHLQIPLDVIRTVTSNVPLKSPNNSSDPWTEKLIVMGSAVKTNEKLPGKTMVEVSFKVTEDGTPANANRQFRHTFFLTDASLEREAVVRDMGTSINLRLLVELAKAIGITVDSNLIESFNGTQAVQGNAIVLAKVNIREDQNGEPQLNIKKFGAVK